MVAAKVLDPQLWMLAVQRRSELHKAELQAHRQKGWLLVAAKTLNPQLKMLPAQLRAELHSRNWSTGTHFFEFSIIGLYVQA